MAGGEAQPVSDVLFPRLRSRASGNLGEREMRNRRKKLTIDSIVQRALVRRVLYHWAYFLILSIILLPLWVAIASWDIVNSFLPFRQAIIVAAVRIFPLAVFLLALVPLIIHDILTLSNRFAGPMYRLHTAIKSLAAGEEVRPLQLRKDDFWQDVIADFNTLAEQVNTMRREKALSASLEPAACGPSEVERS
jgi:hypothetical protein